jgi:hypothetical protein
MKTHQIGSFLFVSIVILELLSGCSTVPVTGRHELNIVSAGEETQLGLTCGRCDQKLHGANAREDNFWRMECACRTYLGRNPLSNAQKRGQA